MPRNDVLSYLRVSCLPTRPAGVSKLIFYQNFASYRLENWLPVIISCHYEVLYDYLKKFLIKKNWKEK